MKRRAPPALGLSLQFADARHRTLLPRRTVARWLRAALEGPAELAVRIVGTEEGQALNRDYRGKDYATNVLTFTYGEGEGQGAMPAGGGPPVLTADLILCAPVVEREAGELGKPLAAHYAHLLVHGALHAQGHDHETEDGAAVMEQREREVLAALGFDDPYA